MPPSRSRSGAGERPSAPGDSWPACGKAGVQGRCFGKLTSAARHRACVGHVAAKLGVTERFACRVRGQSRLTRRTAGGRRSARPPRRPARPTPPQPREARAACRPAGWGCRPHPCWQARFLRGGPCSVRPGRARAPATMPSGAGTPLAPQGSRIGTAHRPGMMTGADTVLQTVRVSAPRLRARSAACTQAAVMALAASTSACGETVVCW